MEILVKCIIIEDLEEIDKIKESKIQSVFGSAHRILKSPVDPKYVQGLNQNIQTNDQDEVRKKYFFHFSFLLSQPGWYSSSRLHPCS